MIQVLDAKPFLEEHSRDMFYVGFLKSAETWFPLCLISHPEEKQQLDTLFLSLSYQAMTQTLEAYAKQVPQVEQTFVQCLMSPEVQNLLDRFSLENIALVTAENGEEGACGCGCGCP